MQYFDSVQRYCIHYLISATVASVSLSGLVDAEESPLSTREQAFFESKIRPLLVENCYSCHSVEAGVAEGGLRLDSAAGMRTGGKSGPVINLRNPERSLLILSIRHEKPAVAMPPADVAGKLADNEIATLEKWVRAGAPDPRQQAEGQEISHPPTMESLASWWSFQPIQKANPPADDAGWSAHPIDRFVFAVQQSRGITAVQDANATQLLRRIYYDLTGLPPTLEQADQFEAVVRTQGLDSAYQKIVDQLLASDQFGVHWGRHWLDVARYAESSGKEFNSNYPHAWRYRNWVIDALNADLPYDKFLQKQIAGDLLPTRNSSDAAANTIATGFLALGSKSLNEMVPRQFAVDQADEQIDAVFQASMGLTMACARCHDHKFDPISQRDYTAVAGIFLSTKTHYGTISRNANTRNVSSLLELPQGSGVPVILQDISPQQYSLRREKLATMQKELAEKQSEALRSRQRGDERFQEIFRDLNLIRSETLRLETELAEFTPDGKVVPLAMGVKDLPVQSEQRRFVAAMRQRTDRELIGAITDSPFLTRGEIALAGDKVPRSIPTLFGKTAAFEIPNDESGRLQLAQWIVAPENPMTARVAVNRMWGWLLGDAIVDSVDNFGTSGSTPSHPELLDYLANQFIKSGWRQKDLVKQIVLSRTYRLASIDNISNFAIDPSNTTFWRANHKRLPAEAIRDSILMAAESLDLRMQQGSDVARAGDGPVRPMQPVQLNPKDTARRDSNRRPYDFFFRAFIEKEDRGRTIYVGFPRDEQPEIFELFDGANGTVVQGIREVTNVPNQSLFMLNSPLVHFYSTRVARNALQANALAKSDAQSIIDVFRHVLVRSPSDQELIQVRSMLDELRGDKTEAYASLARTLFATSEFRYLD